MERPIPRSWCAAVARILRSGNDDAIVATAQAVRDWNATFPGAWNYEWFASLATALDAHDVSGRPIPTMAEPGETWAFWFHFMGRKLYAKINLRPGGQIIIIYSTHPPRKGDDRL